MNYKSKRLLATRQSLGRASASGRRQFLKTGAMDAAALMTLPASKLAAQAVLAPFPGMPRATPSFYLPTDTLNPGAENIKDRTGDPSTIYDFEGVVTVYEGFGGVGIATIAGVETTAYWAADVRYISGRYLDMDGQERQGGVYFSLTKYVFEDSGLSSQTLDFNPGVADNGLFWTDIIGNTQANEALPRI